MIKRPPLAFSEEEHIRLVQIKNTTGLNWSQFVIKAAEAYAREMI